MKTIQTAALVIVAGAIVTLTGCHSIRRSNKERISPSITSQLDGKYPNWCLSQVHPEAETFIELNSLTESPAIAHGDFNGDGLNDIGLLIDHGKHNLLIIAHRTEGPEGYKILQFNEWADYILVSRKGEGGYDHNTQKEFIFPLDSVQANTFEKSARAYIFKDGKYYIAATSD